MGDVISGFWITFDLVEGRGGREFEGVGEEVQWQRWGHPDDDVFHYSLYQYALSETERYKHEA